MWRVPRGEKGARVWGPAFFGATTSDSNADYSGPLARGNVFRRNALRNQAYVRVGGQTVDTLVEKNVIQHSPKGVVIDPSVRRTLLRRNQFDDVAEPQHGGEPAVN